MVKERSKGWMSMNNKELIERYPFLMPRNRWTGKIPEEFNYSYTELDAMPDGWRKAFGERMCEEIRNALIEENYLDEYRISQIKEKYGMLRWYSFGTTQKVEDIIYKYEYISRFICMNCGRPYAKELDIGWVYTLCENCASYMFPAMTHLYWVDATDDFQPIKKSTTIKGWHDGKEYTREIPVWDTWCAIVEDYLNGKYGE